MSILAELYHEWHEPREKPREEGHKAWERNENLWLEAERCLDAELLDKLKQSVADLMDLEACREFEEGFRLGAQLMLELRLSAALAVSQVPLSSTASAPVRCPIPTL